MTDRPPKSLRCKTKIGTYRIRWARVTTILPFGRRTEIMCIAERRNWLCWWSVIGAEWRMKEQQAAADIDEDVRLRSQLPPIKIIGADNV